MSISVLTLLCVYLHYNALYIKLKLFALYNNIFWTKVSKTENRFSTTENRFSQKTGFNIPTCNRLSFIGCFSIYMSVFSISQSLCISQLLLLSLWCSVSAFHTYIATLYA